MEEERQYNGQNKKDKRTHIDLKTASPVLVLNTFYIEFGLFPISVQMLLCTLLFPYANAEHVTSILAIFVNMKTEPVFVNFKLHRLSK